MTASWLYTLTDLKVAKVVGDTSVRLGVEIPGAVSRKHTLTVAYEGRGQIKFLSVFFALWETHHDADKAAQPPGARTRTPGEREVACS